MCVGILYSSSDLKLGILYWPRLLKYGPPFVGKYLDSGQWLNLATLVRSTVVCQWLCHTESQLADHHSLVLLLVLCHTVCLFCVIHSACSVSQSVTVKLIVTVCWARNSANIEQRQLVFRQCCYWYRFHLINNCVLSFITIRLKDGWHFWMIVN